MVTIKNGILKAVIDENGAHLKGICGEKSGKEYMWCADPAIWGKCAPVMFPAVGVVWKNMYRLDGKAYELGKHGFLRDVLLAVKAQSEDSVTFTYSPSEQIKKNYPFDFIFDATFSVKGNVFSLAYTVENTGDKTMYFSLGSHPGFAITLGDKVVFEKEEEGQFTYLDADNNPTGIMYDKFDGKSVTLEADTFVTGTLAFGAPISERVSLYDRDGEYMCMNMGEAPHLWLWAKPAAGYVCIEPWYGSDECVREENIEKKCGIVALEAGKKFTLPLTFTFPRE